MRLDYKKNLGNLDRIIRTAIGLFMFWLVFAGIATGWWAAAAIIFGLFQFVEAGLAY